MTAEEAVAQLIAAEGGLCVLDKIYLPHPYGPDPGPALKFGLGAELYFHDDDRTLMRERSIAVLHDYWRRHAAQVDEYLASDARQAKPFKGDPLAMIRADAARFPSDDGFSSSLFGYLDLVPGKDFVPPYQAHVLVGRQSRDRLSFVNTTIQTCGGDSSPRFTDLLDSVLNWAALLRPRHGAAGFTLVADSFQVTRDHLSFIRRFPGFDIQDGVEVSMELGITYNRIKCVNWLTILADDLVAELGGLQAMRAALEPWCKLHRYLGGVVIQAGVQPVIGDSSRGEIPEAYRLVARFTKPVRFEAYESGLFRVPQGVDKREETLRWIRRFD